MFNRKRDPLVTIVVPIYNAEGSLKECIDSILGQSYENLEIILVNDGSTDKSLEIIEGYAANDKRVKVISHENQGPGYARNAGIKSANGKYIIFWDSDDLFRKDAIQKLTAKAEETGADLCLCNAQAIDAKTGEHRPAEFIRKQYPEKEPFSWEDFPEELFLTSTVAWNKLVRLDLLKEEHIVFPDGIYEDFVYTLLLMRLAKGITVLRERPIFYKVNREGSLTFDAENKTESRIKSHVAAYQELNRRGLMDDKRVAGSFFHKLAIDYRFFIRFFNDYSGYEAFYNAVTSEESALSYYKRDEYDIPAVNDFFDYDAKEYLFLELKRQFDDAMRFRQLGIERGKTIRKLQNQIKSDH